jgi:hypothetical protein
MSLQWDFRSTVLVDPSASQDLSMVAPSKQRVTKHKAGEL